MSLCTGPFELTEQLRPLDAPSQQEKASQEIREVLEAAASAPAPIQSKAQAAQTVASAQAKHFYAEDLVLRAIQAEYGATLSRQVTAGADMGFDGTFVTNGRLNIVEVKYVASARSITRLRESLDRLVGAISRYGWKDVQIILAVVFENPDDVAKGVERLQALSVGVRVQVAIRGYSLADLQRRFGVSTEVGDSPSVEPAV